ncbi:hypothetical protein DSO57_1003243 [Entomophthora muscae]|uniref:Uncharacterized protein n=1 Tax=Entomophthora muscae TaxID=34485 RepID=A0ACC2TW48_9FUNG|nr:hypothetical protein DSO57_1003243 [Entomophthora muscae]
MENNNYSAYPTWDFKKQKTYRPTNTKCLMRNITSSTLCHVCKEGNWSQFLQRHLREGSLISGEKLTIEWTLKDSPATQYNGKLTIPSPAKGRWTANVTFSSPEIHQKSHNWANDHQTIKVE